MGGDLFSLDWGWGRVSGRSGWAGPERGEGPRSDFEAEEFLGCQPRLVLEGIATQVGIAGLCRQERGRRGRRGRKRRRRTFLRLGGRGIDPNHLFLLHVLTDGRFQREQVIVVHFRKVIPEEIRQPDDVFNIMSRLSPALGYLHTADTNQTK